MKNNVKVLIVVSLLAAMTSNAQTVDQNQITGQTNVISTAVPFLNISSESRSSAMGESGVASKPDVFSQALNPAKYAFIENKMGVSLSYTPWLRKLTNDINLYYLSGYYRIDKNQVIGTSLRYFSVGSILMKSANDAIGYEIKPNEYALDASYSRLLSGKFSGSVAFRFIHSNLFGGMVEGMEAGNSIAADIAFFYNETINRHSQISAGINLQNIGSKISYDGGTTKQFIPTNLKIGACYKYEIDIHNSISALLDFNKLMVPTPSEGSTDQDGYWEENKDVSVVSGMFNSFGDAPGGFKEELKEFNISLGTEYVYNDEFALRAGYFHESEMKGNRKYISIGSGIAFNKITIDASYLVSLQTNNPLANTVRFSMSFKM